MESRTFYCVCGHETRSLTGMRPYRCLTCGRRFQRRMTLVRWVGLFALLELAFIGFMLVRCRS